MRIHWDPSVPTHLKEVIEPLLKKRIGIIPAWLYDLTVKYESTNDSFQSISPSYEQRCATLYLTSVTLESKTVEGDLVHELCHLYTATITNAFDKCSKAQKDVMEAMTCDMAELVLNLT